MRILKFPTVSGPDPGTSRIHADPDPLSYYRAKAMDKASCVRPVVSKATELEAKLFTKEEFKNIFDGWLHFKQTFELINSSELIPVSFVSYCT